MDNTSCEEFNKIEYSILSGIRALLGLFSLVCCLLVILVILLFKRYHYFVQRLVLFVCTSAAINSLAIMAQKIDYVTGYTDDSVFDKYCVFAGFFELFTSQVELIALLCITHGLYRSVIKQKPKKYFEAVYISLSFIIPCILCCVPFFGSSYGKTGPWCGIRERDDNCEPFYLGIIFQFALWYAPLILVTLVVLCVSVASLYRVHKSIESRWQGPYDPEVFAYRGRLKKGVKVILAYLPILFLIVNLLSLPNAIYWAIGDEPLFPLWVLHAVSPLRGALLALPYLFHDETRRQISKINIKAAVKRRFNRKMVTTYPAKPCTFSDSLTFPSSADTTIERQKPYHNPSLKYNTPTPPNTVSPLHTVVLKPPVPVPEEVVTLNLDGDSSTLSSVTLTQSTTMSSGEVGTSDQYNS